MERFFLILTSVVCVQRIVELLIAKRHTQWMKARGGKEFGAEHYPLIVFVHVLFFVSMAVEVFAFKRTMPSWWWGPFTLFLIAQLLRYWCIRSLGRFWNTRIVVLPQAKVVHRGPYRFMRHPNYAVVTLELLSLPLIFGAYVTCIAISLLNMAVLKFVRIPAEERALSALTNYREEFGKRT